MDISLLTIVSAVTVIEDNTIQSEFLHVVICEGS